MMDLYDNNNRRDETAITRCNDLVSSFQKHHQIFMDRITPLMMPRWIFSGITLSLFLLRVFLGGGWYIICYALGIYYLSLFVDFLSPKFDPDYRSTIEDMDPDSGPSLPTRVNEEFKPFIRRLPEYKFWYLGTRATLVSLFLSLFDAFDLPVYWPILLVYFVILLILTLRKQIQHMMRYSYVPWSTGKTRYGQG